MCRMHYQAVPETFLIKWMKIHGIVIVAVTEHTFSEIVSSPKFVTILS